MSRTIKHITRPCTRPPAGDGGVKCPFMALLINKDL